MSIFEQQSNPLKPDEPILKRLYLLDYWKTHTTPLAQFALKCIRVNNPQVS